MEYQSNFLELYPDTDNKAKKIKKAKKINSILQDYLEKKGEHISNLNCLDLGCSTGIITIFMAPYYSTIIGTDIDDEAIKKANEMNNFTNCNFVVADGMELPFENDMFDIIICNHVYEHVPNDKNLMKEIHRVLKKNGICYFGGGHKYQFIEPHYKLPFLSWLPQKLANVYIRQFTKHEIYYEKFRTRKGMENLLKDFRTTEYTFEIVKNPDKYYIDLPKLALLIPKVFLRMLSLFIPTYIYILEKEGGNQ